MESNLLSFVMQFLQDTLDTLFGILDQSSQRFGLKVFDCLVSAFIDVQTKTFLVSPCNSFILGMQPNKSLQSIACMCIISLWI